MSRETWEMTAVLAAVAIFVTAGASGAWVGSSAGCSPAAQQEESVVSGDVVKVADAACVAARLAGSTDQAILDACAKEAAARQKLQAFVSQCRAEQAEAGK